MSCRGVTTLSLSLGGIIVNSHRGLLQAIAKEQHPGVLLQIVMALKILVKGTPYNRLQQGLLTLSLSVGPSPSHPEPCAVHGSLNAG